MYGFYLVLGFENQWLWSEIVDVQVGTFITLKAYCISELKNKITFLQGRN
jgi:hypothetical protein